MSSRKHLGFALALLAGIVALGGLLLVWPAYGEGARLDRRVKELYSKNESYDTLAREIAGLSLELDELTRVIDTRLKRIPETSDIAGLMRVLSLPVDGVHIRDQTFTAGAVRRAVPGSDLPVQVQPLTVDMQARFDSVFALMRATESMDRLLRISSLNLSCDRRREEDPVFATASVVIEAVFHPSEEGR